jgi:hypothetical protein
MALSIPTLLHLTMQHDYDHPAAQNTPARHQFNDR